MPNLINTYEGNTFYNYLTPLVPGEPGLVSNASFFSLFEEAFGVTDLASFGFPNLFFRFPAPGLESKTGAVGNNYTSARYAFFSSNANQFGTFVNTASGVGTDGAVIGTPGGGGVAYATGDCYYVALNEYSICVALMNSARTVGKQFTYCGWLREPSYIASTAPRGLISIDWWSGTFSQAIRPTQENQAFTTDISVTNNAITNPIITCSTSTPGADATDIVIRDNVAPNYAIGKLYNCVSLPNSAVVGEIWKNNGIDPETGSAYTSNNVDKYLVIMPWGGRKLGMRIWTEDYV